MKVIFYPIFNTAVDGSYSDVPLGDGHDNPNDAMSEGKEHLKKHPKGVHNENKVWIRFSGRVQSYWEDDEE